MLFGIALIDSLPFRITCDVTLLRGTGEILISGPVDPNIEETINASIGFASTLSDFGEGNFPDLSNHNIHIRIRLPSSPAPIVGPSYGLLLSLQLVCALLRRRPSISAFVTGEVNFNGDVLPVGGIAEKRKGASELCAERLILPASQLDFFATSIIQIPVSTIFEAYRAVTYGEA